jgi:hypothetical protein
MKNKTSKTISVLASLVMAVLALAGSGFAQGNGKGNGQEKKHGIAKIFKWPDSWKSGRKSNGNGKMNRYKGLSKKTGHSPESLWAWYESERSRNPRLTHGQFVAANMIARNPRKGLTPQTVLDGLRNGDSIGQVLHRRGMTEKEIREERKRVRRLIDDDRDFNYEYDDLDSYWRIRR